MRGMSAIYNYNGGCDFSVNQSACIVQTCESIDKIHFCGGYPAQCQPCVQRMLEIAKDKD